MLMCLPMDDMRSHARIHLYLLQYILKNKDERVILAIFSSKNFILS